MGWITQLIIGVAYWMFPRPRRHAPAVSDRLGWVGYVALNFGLLCRLAGEPAGSRAAGWVLPLSAVLQLCGIVAFVAILWPRVRTR